MKGLLVLGLAACAHAAPAPRSPGGRERVVAPTVVEPEPGEPEPPEALVRVRDRQRLYALEDEVQACGAGPLHARLAVSASGDVLAVTLDPPSDCVLRLLRVMVFERGVLRVVEVDFR